MRSLIPVVVVAVCALCGCSHDGGGTGSASSTSSAAGSAHVRDCRSQLQARPSEIVLTCADANHSVSDITWESWTSDSAQGSGTENKNTCEPSCAEGQHLSAPVTIRLSNPADGVFTQLEITQHDGKSETERLPR
ncbi:hypothetical protein [Nocardia terpenica]|uniref:Uncharacterized protein n=1 Tax=Nocardia terpenica TaxID=455432 RepID=A0A6G9Z7U9_9NOCA|nr:hypothetical protein [Nocardia terpenica]QIS21524.1 hypothetical protein F6W96_27500 [Nocardia terpenica]